MTPDHTPIGRDNLIELCWKAATLMRPEESQHYTLNHVLPLMVLTCATESVGMYRRQLGVSPGVGAYSLFQMEKLAIQENLARVFKIAPELVPNKDILDFLQTKESDLLAACMCRMYYLPKAGAIPGDPAGCAEYWKKHYNTVKGKGRAAKAVLNFFNYVEVVDYKELFRDVLKERGYEIVV